jgi:hypothetical protein
VDVAARKFKEGKVKAKASFSDGDAPAGEGNVQTGDVANKKAPCLKIWELTVSICNQGLLVVVILVEFRYHSGYYCDLAY